MIKMNARGWCCAPVGSCLAVFAAALPVALVDGGPQPVQVGHTQSIYSRDGRHLIATIPTALPGMPQPTDWGGTAAPPGSSSRSIVWQRMSCPANVYVKAISMANAQVGFAAAEMGIVLRSTDGGNTWQIILNQGFPYYYYGVQAFSANTVLITGFNNSTGEGILRWSDNGGASWGSIVILTAPTYFDWLYFVKFVDANRGVIQGWGGGTFYTTTGGRNASDWIFTAPTDNWWAGTFTFLPDGRVWMTGYDNFRSLDGGATWTRIADADPTFDGPNGVLADGKGYIGGGSISPTVAGWLYATTNGGDSWSSRILTTPYPVRAILCLDDNRAWAAGGNVYSNVGGIWGTEDGGATWKLEQNTGAEILDMTTVPVSATQLDVYAAGQVSHIWRAHVTVPSPVGDLNCDGSVNFGDINPFVLFLSNFALWQATYDCPPENGDINGDGSYPSFGDINPFVALLTGMP
jgi:photosystem II stability/assembly factor-like uncharacterized protein